MRLSWPKSAPVVRRPGSSRPPMALSIAAFRPCSALRNSRRCDRRTRNICCGSNRDPDISTSRSRWRFVRSITRPRTSTSWRSWIRASLADVRTTAAACRRLRERVQRARFRARPRGLRHPDSLPRSRPHPRGGGGGTAAREAQCRTRDAPGVDGSIRGGPRWLSRAAARSAQFRRSRATRGARGDRSQSAAECEDVEDGGGGMGALPAGIFGVSRTTRRGSCWRSCPGRSGGFRRRASACSLWTIIRRGWVAWSRGATVWVGSRCDTTRDISHIYVRDLETREFRSVGRRDGRLGPMTLWEHKCRFRCQYGTGDLPRNSFGFNWDWNLTSVPIETENSVRSGADSLSFKCGFRASSAFLSVDLFADDAFNPDIQAPGAVGSAAAGRNQTRCLSRRAEPSDHSVDGRSTDSKLVAHRFDDHSRGRPVVRLQQAT